MLQIVALVRRELTHLETVQYRIPTRRVIRAAFPRVVYDEQSGVVGITLLGQIVVPLHNTRKQLANSVDNSGCPLTSRELQDPL
jgi:hypothetical protein